MIIYKRVPPRLLSKWIVSNLCLYLAWCADPTHHVGVSLQTIFRIREVAFCSCKAGKRARGGMCIPVAFYILRNTRALSTDCTIGWAVSLTAALLELLEASLWVLLGGDWMVCKIAHWNLTKSLTSCVQTTQNAPKYSDVSFIFSCLFNRKSQQKAWCLLL